MSIDFTGVNGIADDYGNVKQISDAQGNVLWSAKPSEATVTITGSGGNANMVWVTINGVDYREATSVNVPIGTVITCNPYGSVILNGQTVANGTGVTYNYTVTKNVAINMNWRQGTGTITITEIPEGHALVNITGSGNATYCYATINGTKYTTATTLVLPVGTVVTCTAKDKDDDYSAVFLNGQIVAGRSSNAVYDYSVTRDVEIKLSTSPSASYEQEIFITET